MAVNPQQELVWQGRIHLGDEPGIYGDASYSGLTVELPLTVQRLDPSNTDAKSFRIVLDTQGLQTFEGFPGHEITVTIYEPDPEKQYHFVERILAREQFTGKDNNHKEITTNVGDAAGPFRISVSVRCDTEVTPGLYDDFVWRRLSLLAENFAFFASFGFPS
ncbi:hypothetical protein KR51_00019150 [Rubidibacter lacunae KORDI 51-2]|uniref:Uncharacterized protein n=1 Tax=Rubidibacter lacunae KORDI 51-2 TaxID=582515 RepID=U5D9T5_9CHRO|nr:hypothetical protein [Rubidibacter lacunae]ERN41348.1 hypothetical protein KR51_00019150 [Rubidibacter lacunae KORDI 51-2]